MSLRSENVQLRQEVHTMLGDFRDDDKKIHAWNADLRPQVAGLRDKAREFVAQCHATNDELKTQVAELRAATREFVWGNGGPRSKGKQAAGGEQEPAPRPRTKKARKKRAK